MAVELDSRKITVDDVGAFVLHGTDRQKQAVVLDALAAAEPVELVGLLMGAAYGAEETEILLEGLGGGLEQSELQQKVRKLLRRPWPASTDLEFDVASLPDDDFDSVQRVTFEFENGNATLAGALTLTEKAAKSA